MYRVTTDSKSSCEFPLWEFIKIYWLPRELVFFKSDCKEILYELYCSLSKSNHWSMQHKRG